MVRIVLMGVVSALLLGSSLNLGAVNDPELGPGPWGKLASVAKYPNDGPLKYATVLYNNVGSLYGKNAEDIKDAVESCRAQKKWVAADTDAGIVPADTMTVRIQKTGGLIKEDPIVAGAPSLYAQATGVNTALGGTGSTWNRIDEVGALIQKDTQDTAPHDGVSPAISLADRATAVRSWVQTDDESDAFVVDPDPPTTGTVDDSTYTRVERVAQIIHHDAVINGDNGVFKDTSLATRARVVRDWVQTDSESDAFIVDPGPPGVTGNSDDSTYTRIARVKAALGGEGTASIWARIGNIENAIGKIGGQLQRMADDSVAPKTPIGEDPAYSSLTTLKAIYDQLLLDHPDPPPDP